MFMKTASNWVALALLALPLGVLAASPASLYEFTVNSLDGKAVPLKTYQGKVALVVNTASECGFTPQYEGLEKLYQNYAKKGLVVMGFPSNDFGGQEPGSSAEIQQFCSSKFHVTFPMFEKVTVRVGPGQAPVYKFLSSKGDIPSWNFGKYLVNKQGKLVAFFGSTTRPDDPKLVSAIEAALK